MSPSGKAPVAGVSGRSRAGAVRFGDPVHGHGGGRPVVRFGNMLHGHPKVRQRAAGGFPARPDGKDHRRGLTPSGIRKSPPP